MCKYSSWVLESDLKSHEPFSFWLTLSTPVSENSHRQSFRCFSIEANFVDDFYLWEMSLFAVNELVVTEISYVQDIYTTVSSYLVELRNLEVSHLVVYHPIWHLMNIMFVLLVIPLSNFWKKKSYNQTHTHTRTKGVVYIQCYLSHVCALF